MDQILEVWKDHFENIATPNMIDKSLDIKENLATIRNKIIESVETITRKIIPDPEDEVLNAIRKLNSGKYADDSGLSAEHFKYAMRELTPIVQNII